MITKITLPMVVRSFEIEAAYDDVQAKMKTGLEEKKGRDNEVDERGYGDVYLVYGIELSILPLWLSLPIRVAEL